MNLLSILKIFLEENNCDIIKTNTIKNDIHFKKYKKEFEGHHGYQINVTPPDIKIRRMRLVTAGMNGRTYVVPEIMTLLSIDIHSPNSLRHIREWLQTI